MTDKVKNRKIFKVLALCKFSGVYPRLMEALLTHYGNIERIIKADAGSLMTISGMTGEIANRITKASTFLVKAEEYYRTLTKRNIAVISRFDDNYPHRLFELNNPPSILYIRGKIPDKNKKIAALVGTEKATGNGIDLTVKIAKKFTKEGVQIISSLNKGIDSAAHLGSKAANGTSFSILNSGVENIYPEENRPLAIDIVQNGGIISEYPPDIKFSKDNYKSSNRVIAGMAQAVVVTECYNDSTSLLDLLSCCCQVGKLSFIIIDPRYGALADKDSFNKAISFGAIPLVGLDKIDDIILSLV